MPGQVRDDQPHGYRITRPPPGPVNELNRAAHDDRALGPVAADELETIADPHRTLLNEPGNNGAAATLIADAAHAGFPMVRFGPDETILHQSAAGHFSPRRCVARALQSAQGDGATITSAAVRVLLRDARREPGRHSRRTAGCWQGR